ncbi:SRPBCC domain-containing protein [Parapusillimonas sp. SGNA-6]|uniref:SRPBCC domain-containing protein n=1 Tax=Parapedobacter sp. SGR-10 TaxID=2710879 RepID=UPI0013D5826A|nr:SRPBCC domain-containing protein [Parapedobacter sp. SGR-10]NGF55826.1 SRPBCC domain-containing protein [Parapedobacter sp. SGR-10]NGM89939.1 SRPBCC domain-containing protein [Parapusillimonas sp. SGNA-6]
MERLQYKIDINAPAAKVTELMLGKDTYKLWTAEFEPTSDFEGSWGKGDKIYFTGIDEEGKKGGMVSEIAEHIPHRFVSIRHYGILDDGKEITEGEQVEKWAGGFENYTYEEKDGVTTVTVDLDTTPDFIAYFDKTYPKALNRLKEICEK